MTTVNPTKKSDIDPNFEKQINSRQTDAQQEGEQRKSNEQVQWTKPDNWSGDPFDWQGIQDTFQRDKANEDYEKSVSDAEDPGTSGDLVATTTQVDYLSVMGRAFQSRMSGHSFARAVAHQTARKRGHGNVQGVFKRSALQYVRGVLKQAGGQ